MTPEEILKKYELKVTYARIKVLELFQNHPFALSHPFLEKNIDTIDRVTLYRTLNTFEHEGIIHKVLDDSCTLKYALCIDFCKHHDKKHKHEHLHFQCIKCNQTTCLQVQIPCIEVPDGYEIIDTHFSVKGVCKKCNQILSHPNS
jgi:Fur family ferric uptake transcriptional regulator